MTDRTQSGRPVRDSRRRFASLLALGTRFLVVSTSVLLLVGGAVGGYLLGRDMATRPLAAANELLERLQPESQRLKTTVLGQNATIAALQAKLASAQAALNAVMPSENTYNVRANQSLIVAGGHLTIGLVGAPSNAAINININGKQHTAITGDVFHIAPDPATMCEVRVQSFDMFLALINASCAPAKPQ